MSACVCLYVFESECVRVYVQRAGEAIMCVCMCVFVCI